MTWLPAPGVPLEAVIFDLHSTLVDQGPGSEWLQRAWRDAGRDGEPAAVLGAAEFSRLSHALERIWEGAREVDPASERDLDPVRHRGVFDEVVRRMGGIDDELAGSLYATLTSGWAAYDDVVPVLTALRSNGVRTALLSNVGIDIRPVLERTGLAPLLDVVVLSCEIGVTKPEPGAFLATLDRLGTRPDATLMVGDTWAQDGAAAEVGVRALILPRTRGPLHGLDAVTALVTGSRALGPSPA